MTKSIYLISIFMLLALSLAAITVAHIPPKEFTQGLPVGLRLEVIQSWDQIQNAQLKYRAVGQNLWMNEPMKAEVPDGPWLKVEIPALPGTNLGIEYYFEFTLKSGVIETHPVIEPTTNAYVVVPVAREGSLSQDFILLSEGETVYANNGYVLAVSYFAIADDIDLSSMKVYVDGVDVTNRTTVGTNVLLYRIDKPKTGTKTAMIQAKMRNGSSIHSDTWVANVKPGSGGVGLPISVRGSINFASNMYSYTEDDDATTYGKAKDDAASWLDLYGKLRFLDFQSNIYVSSLEESNKQPINRYTFGLMVPYWEAYLGDYSPYLSNFTMNNRNMRGLYTRLHSNSISLTWAHGEMVRKTTSSIMEDSLTVRKTGTFKQEAIGARLQFGSERGLQIGVSGSRNRDIISSLDFDDFAYIRTVDGVVDTLYTVTPKDNLVLSLDARLNIPEQNIVLGIEGAGSMYNRNTHLPAMTTEEIEDYANQEIPINIDAINQLFVINKSIEPLMPSKANTAWTAYFRSHFKFFWDNLFNISYSEVNSAFYALSTNFQQKDMKTLTLSHQMNFYQYFFLMGGYSQSEDNISGHRSETNIYDSYYANSIIRIPRLPYIKASYFVNSSQNKEGNENDSLAVFNPYLRNSKNLSIGLGYNFETLPYAPSQIDVTWRNGTDDSTVSDLLTYDNINSGVNVSIISNYTNVPLKTQIAFSTSNQDLQLVERVNKNVNIFLKAEYRLFDNKLKPFVQYRTINLGGDQEAQSYSYYTLGFDVYPIRDMSINTCLNLNSFSNKDVPDSDYSNTIWRFMVTQRF